MWTWKALLANATRSPGAVVDVTCERLSTQFIVDSTAEPVNTWISIWQAFLGVVLIVRSHYLAQHRKVALHGGIILLLHALCCFLWHLLAVNLLAFVDEVLPVLMFAWFANCWLSIVCGTPHWARWLCTAMLLAGSGVLVLAGDRIVIHRVVGIHWAWLAYHLGLVAIHALGRRRAPHYRPRLLGMALLCNALSLLFFGLDRVMQRSGQCTPAIGWHWAYQLCLATGFFMLVLTLHGDGAAVATRTDSTAKRSKGDQTRGRQRVSPLDSSVRLSDYYPPRDRPLGDHDGVVFGMHSPEAQVAVTRYATQHGHGGR